MISWSKTIELILNDKCSLFLSLRTRNTDNEFGLFCNFKQEIILETMITLVGSQIQFIIAGSNDFLSLSTFTDLIIIEFSFPVAHEKANKLLMKNGFQYV